MKCSVDKRTVTEMRLQNNQTKYKKNLNKPVQKRLVTELEVPLHTSKYQTFKSLGFLSIFNMKKTPPIT